jgi:hypothetical protein
VAGGAELPSGGRSAQETVLLPLVEVARPAVGESPALHMPSLAAPAICVFCAEAPVCGHARYACRGVTGGLRRSVGSEERRTGVELQGPDAVGKAFLLFWGVPSQGHYEIRGCMRVSTQPFLVDGFSCLAVMVSCFAVMECLPSLARRVPRERPLGPLTSP